MEDQEQGLKSPSLKNAATIRKTKKNKLKRNISHKVRKEEGNDIENQKFKEYLSSKSFIFAN